MSGTGITLHSSPDGVSSVPPEEDLSGRVFAERYRVERKIGAGGMGQVYLAEHTTIGKVVAIKVLSAAYRSRPDIVTRFLGEARAASALRHEHVVDITDFGRTPDGAVFFVMEYLEGQPLDELLDTEGPLDWARARALMLQVLDALEAAHAKGIVHRDMKPDNCFVVPRSGDREHLKVLDFGIAKVMGGEGSEGLTETGAIMGTANYMSPEQAHGDKLDHRTDLYSCGVMLYEMLAGRRPFEGNNPMSVMFKHLHAEVPPLLEVNPRCEAPGDAEYVLLRALAKDRSERFESAAEFAAALRAVPERGGVPLSSPTGSSSGNRSTAAMSVADAKVDAVSRRPVGAGLWWGLGGAAALLTIGGLVWVVMRPAAPAGEDNGAESGDEVTLAAEAAESPVGGDAELDAKVPPGDEPPSAPASDDPEAPELVESNADTEAAPTADADATESAGDDAGDDRAGTNEAAATGAGQGAKSPKPAAPSHKTRTARTVRRALDKRAKRDVEACLRRGGAFPGERVTARVTVDDAGSVTAVKLGRKHASTPMGKCIEGVLRNANAPAGPGRVDVTVSYAL